MACGRRRFLEYILLGRVCGSAPVVAALAAGLTGCRTMQFARVMMPGEDAMIGSHQAGQETFGPLVNEAVAKLLARHVDSAVQQVSYEGTESLPLPQRRICFVGVENKSAEDIGDFKEQIFEAIDGRILESKVFQSVNRRFVDAGLRDTRLRPDQLLVPEHMRAFAAHMDEADRALARSRSSASSGVVPSFASQAVSGRSCGMKKPWVSPNRRFARILSTPCRAAARGWDVPPAFLADARLPRLSPA
jgi:hypothetical protein